MKLYFYTGAKGYAATTAADLALLVAALLDPSTAANSASINRIVGKIPEMVASDTGIPLELYFSDDGTTFTSWSTNAAVTLIVGLGDQDADRQDTVASTTSFTISGNARLGSLGLNTTEMQHRLREARSLYASSTQVELALHVRKTTAGSTESVAMLPITVLAGVLADVPATLTPTDYVTVPASRTGFVINESGITSLTGGGAAALDGLAAGMSGYPAGCIVVTSISDVGRLAILKATFIAATDLATGKIKPTNSDVSTNAVHWQII